MFNKTEEHKRRQLLNILDKYNTIANKDPYKLRLLLPAKEIWRFFIDGVQQEKGRGLISSDHFKIPLISYFTSFFSKQLIDYTVEEYIKNTDDITSLSFQNLLHRKHWDLSINERKNLTLRDLSLLDRGWLPFEKNEPGYLQALYKAFHLIFDFSSELDISFIKQLHKVATTNVNGTNYSYLKEQAGDFRETFLLSYSLGGNITKDGIEEILKNNRSYNYFKIDIGKNDSLCIFSTLIDEMRNSKETLDSIGNRLNNFKNDDELELLLKNEVKEFITRYCIGDLDSSIDIYNIYKEVDSLSKTKNDQEAAECIYKLIKRGNYPSHFVSEQNDNVRETLQFDMEEIINSYSKTLKTAGDNPFKILWAIIEFIQNCEQLHPFLDANCRTFCMLLLNNLLMRHGFPPAILKDPNNFDGHSVSELLDQVLQGMENSFKLIEEHTLYNVKTDDILNFLTSKPYLKDLVEYFENTIDIEATNREIIDHKKHLVSF